MQKTAVIIGASGLVGSALLKLLLADPDYEKIIAFVRRTLPIQSPKLEQKAFPAIGRPEAQNLKADELFCCLGTTLKKAGSREAFRHVDLELPLAFATAARAAGTPHFLLVSAIGADAKSRIFYSRIKGELEEALKNLNFPSLTFVRPALLVGNRQEHRIGEKVFDLILTLLKPGLVGPLRHLSSVHDYEVAQCLLKAARHPTAGVNIIFSGDIARSPG